MKDAEVSGFLECQASMALLSQIGFRDLLMGLGSGGSF